MKGIQFHKWVLSNLKWCRSLPKKNCSTFNTIMISVLMNAAFRQSPEPWNEAVRKVYKSHADPIPNNVFRYHISSYTIPVPYFQVLYTRHNVAKLSSMAANTLKQLGKISGLKLLERLWKFRYCGTWVKYMLPNRLVLLWMILIYTSHGVTYQKTEFSTYGKICVYHVYYGIQNNPGSETSLRKVRPLLRSKPMEWHSWTNFRQSLPSLCYNH